MAKFSALKAKMHLNKAFSIINKNREISEKYPFLIDELVKTAEYLEGHE